MPRPPRIEYEGACYHVFNRGIERRELFIDADDYQMFLDLVSKLKLRHKVNILAYCLLPNHYHLFVQTMRGELHRYMHELDGQYGKYYNRANKRVGPVFQSRYRALLVQTDRYALGIVRYIHMNPVKAGLAIAPERYRWSSCREYYGQDGIPYADTKYLLGMFGAEAKDCVQLFRKYTMNGPGGDRDPLEIARGRVIIGDDEFMDRMKREKIPRQKKAGMARWNELQKPASKVLESMQKRVASLTDDMRLRKKMVIYGLRHSTPLSVGEIAGITGMKTDAAVSQTIRRLNLARKTDKMINGLLATLDGLCRAGQ